VGALIAVCAVLLVSISASALWADDSIPDPGWTVTAATSTSNLVDGQPVTINVKSRSDVAVGYVEVHECRLNATYTQQSDVLLPAGNCPGVGLSSSADQGLSRTSSSGLRALTTSDAGFNLSFRVGVGTVDWTTPSGPVALTCGPTDPCGLVVLLIVNGNVQYRVFKLTFVDADPIKSCGSANPDALATAGSDELSDAWSTWTRDYCATVGGGAPTRMAFTGEGSALNFYSTGVNDIAYTAAGYDPQLQLDSSGATPRDSVAVPIALNAAVLAVGGGYHPVVDGRPLFDKSPYPLLKVSAAETGALVGGGLIWFGNLNNPYRTSLTQRNPTINGDAYAPDVPGVMASSLPSTTTWTMTSYLSALAPDQFIAPREPPPGHRGATSDFALATPPYDQELLTLSGRAQMSKYTLPLPFSTSDGPVWAVTDRATALALGLAPAALENASGDFVAPTNDTMSAAVATMKPDAQGMLLPDVQATTAPPSSTASSAPGATVYPLTFVEYALVPAEPLMDASTCTARTGAQSLLNSWLQYVTGAGQSKLPAGLEPLTPDLAAQASAAIAKVGTSPVTGPCADAPGAGAAPVGGAGSGSTFGGIPAGSVPSGGSSSFSSLTTTPRVGSAAASSSSDAASGGGDKGIPIAAVPAFAGHKLPDVTGGVIAILGVVIITSLGVSITARLRVGGGARRLQGASGAFTPTAQQRMVAIGALWVAIALLGSALVAYNLGAFLETQDQRQLLSEYRGQVRQAAFASRGLDRNATTTEQPPSTGAPVGIVEIGSLRLQQVVVEGISPSETSRGPGHVPGTAGLGQPGNSVLLARRNAFGGPFGDLSTLHTGARITVTTTQGQSVYVVRAVQRETIGNTTSKRDSTVTTDGLFGPSKDDQLTLVTSGSSEPWNSSDATVVTAKMRGTPFTPQLQGARTAEETSMSGQSDAWPGILLAFLGYVAVVVASVLAYRRFRFPVAYALTLPPLLAVTVVLGQNLTRLLPTWA
jgi:sortase A